MEDRKFEEDEGGDGKSEDRRGLEPPEAGKRKQVSSYELGPETP